MRETSMRRRNIDQLPLAYARTGTWPATQACAPTGNQIHDLSVCGTRLNPLNHTSQGDTFEERALWECFFSQSAVLLK